MVQSYIIPYDKIASFEGSVMVEDVQAAKNAHKKVQKTAKIYY